MRIDALSSLTYFFHRFAKETKDLKKNVKKDKQTFVQRLVMQRR